MQVDLAAHPTERAWMLRVSQRTDLPQLHALHHNAEHGGQPKMVDISSSCSKNAVVRWNKKGYLELMAVVRGKILMILDLAEIDHRLIVQYIGLLEDLQEMIDEFVRIGAQDAQR